NNKTACVTVVAQADYISASAAHVCKYVNFDSEKLSCVRTIADKQYSSFAADACMTFDFASNKIACLTALADKELDPRAAEVCRGQNSDSQKLPCLQQAARPMRRERSCDSIEILGHVQAARAHLHYRDIRAADRSLERLESQ